jgi:hypothetical protein
MQAAHVPRGADCIASQTLSVHFASRFMAYGGEKSVI